MLVLLYIVMHVIRNLYTLYVWGVQILRDRPYLCGGWTIGCGHCKRLAPAYEEVGKAFNGVDNVLIAKVDADGDRALGGRFGVRGFPTLKFFPQGSTEPEE